MGKPFIHAIRGRAAFAAFLVALSGAAPRFSYSQAPESAKYSNSLIAVAGATNTSYAILSEGRQQLSYVTESDYPATKILSFISNDLRKKGWNTLDQDFMNPGLPSSHIRGWTVSGEGIQGSTSVVHQWSADWENEEHDIVRYDLEYRSLDGSTRDLRTLRVTAIYIPARTAAVMKRAIASTR